MGLLPLLKVYLEYSDDPKQTISRLPLFTDDEMRDLYTNGLIIQGRTIYDPTPNLITEFSSQDEEEDYKWSVITHYQDFSSCPCISLDLGDELGLPVHYNYYIDDSISTSNIEEVVYNIGYNSNLTFEGVMKMKFALPRYNTLQGESGETVLDFILCQPTLYRIVTLKDVLNHPELKWSWEYISKRAKITIQDVLENPHLPWDIVQLMINPYITFENILENPQLFGTTDVCSLAEKLQTWCGGIQPKISWKTIIENPHVNWCGLLAEHAGYDPVEKEKEIRHESEKLIRSIRKGFSFNEYLFSEQRICRDIRALHMFFRMMIRKFRNKGSK